MSQIQRIAFALLVFLAVPVMSFAADENPYAQQSQVESQKSYNERTAPPPPPAPGQTISDTKGNPIGAIVTNPQTGIKTVIDGAGNAIGTVTGGVNGGVQTITNGAGQVIGTITGGINGAVGTVTNAAGQVIGGVTNGINGAIGGITSGIGSAIGGVTSGINGAISGITGGISSALGGMLGGGGGAPTATAATFANMGSISQVCDFGVSTKTDLKVISRSVACFEKMFMGIVEDKLTQMTDVMRQAVFAFLVLYVIFYGIKTSTGIISEQRARGEFFIHILKIAFVSWMIMNYGILELWYLTLDVYNGLLELVLVPTSLGVCQPSVAAVPGLWQSMDCILANFIGWNAKPNWNGVPLVFGMFTSALNSGAGGGFIAMLVFMSIFSILMSLIRVAFIYILSMMALILAFMISPIIIPLMLFPQTKEMFNGWWKVIISMVMQPVILFGYLSFMLGIFVEIIDGPNGLKEIYQQVSPNMQVGSTVNRGTDTGITSVFSMFKKGSGTIELNASLVFNLISIFVISYLLSAFTTFVAQMGKELSGNSLSPDLSGSVPAFLK